MEEVPPAPWVVDVVAPGPEAAAPPVPPALVATASRFDVRPPQERSVVAQIDSNQGRMRVLIRPS
jgi:hypothetical protein